MIEHATTCTCAQRRTVTCYSVEEALRLRSEMAAMNRAAQDAWKQRGVTMHPMLKEWYERRYGAAEGNAG